MRKGRVIRGISSEIIGGRRVIGGERRRRRVGSTVKRISIDEGRRRIGDWIRVRVLRILLTVI